MMLDFPLYGCILFKNYIKPQLSLGVGLFALRCILFKNYIKPQPSTRVPPHPGSCILFKNYIKPQREPGALRKQRVVSYLKTTSNHNNTRTRTWSASVVSYLKTTSNHNGVDREVVRRVVVSYLKTTSNHNVFAMILAFFLLYLI